MPVEAIRVLLDIGLFHRTIIATAASAAYRLGCERKWRADSRHTKFPDEVFFHPIFQISQDKMPVIRVLKAPFRVCFSKREDWLRR